MIKALLQVTGWLCAKSPEFLLRIVAAVIAWTFYYAVPSRRRLIHSNLHHAFPERSRAWRRRMAKECIRRFAETGLLSLATPYLPPRRLRKIITASASMRAMYAAHRASPQPTLICTPHIAYWEVLTAMPLIEQPFPEFGAIFRPLDNPEADRFVKSSRERFGMKLLSRRDGFQEAVRILRRNGMVGILYDQNAGSQGALTLLFDRVCSTTELVGLLAQKFSAQCVGLYARRAGFWRVEICMETIATDGTSEGATVGLNRWLEQLLRSDENMCASWLWGHQRWKNQDAPPARLRLEQKRNLLGAELRYRQLAQLPRKTRLWIRLPNWLGDVVMALPLLRAIRQGRPDAEITLLAKAQYRPLLEKLGLADRVLPLPRKGAGYFGHFWRLREQFPDCTILFTNSLRGDLEAWLTRSRQRFGIARPGKPRRLLTHRLRLTADYDEERHHQLGLWTSFLQQFGLNEAPDTTPLPTPRNARPVIGLICGSENNPEKRWPVERWRSLIAALPEREFLLLGTPNDRAITTAVADGFGRRVENRAGKTSLVEFADALAECALLVTNDTGGMHLANALGVPVVALFGPTNPVRTGPIFQAPVTILQPPGCPATGGAALVNLEPGTVIEAIRSTLNAQANGGAETTRST